MLRKRSNKVEVAVFWGACTCKLFSANQTTWDTWCESIAKNVSIAFAIDRVLVLVALVVAVVVLMLVYMFSLRSTRSLLTMSLRLQARLLEDIWIQ